MALNMTPHNEVGMRLDYGLGNLGIVIRIPKNAEIKNEWSYYSIPPYTFTPIKGNFKFILVRFAELLNILVLLTYLLFFPPGNFPYCLSSRCSTTYNSSLQSCLLAQTVFGEE